VRLKFCIALFVATAGFTSLHAARPGAVDEIPFTQQEGLIWIQVRASGVAQPLEFVLDSGADTSVLHLQTARRLGLAMSRTEKVRGVGSQADAYRVENFKAKFGRLPLPRSLLVVDLSEVSKACNRTIDGLLGVDFFRDRVVQIDFEAGRIRLLKRTDERGSDAVLPLQIRRRAMCVLVGVSDRAPRWTRLDTGCNEGLILAVRPKGRSRTERGSAIGLVRNQRKFERATVNLGGESIPRVNVVLHEGEIFAGEAGLLGNGILANYLVTVDAVGQRLILKKRSS
jgi:hypothetical protein